MSMAFEAVSYGDAGYVLFIVTNTATNKMYFQIREEQKTNGLWQLSPDARPVGSQLTGQRGERHSHPVPKTTNVWRLAVHYFFIPTADTFAMRTRDKLMNFAYRRRWVRLGRWLSPVKQQTIYGPEMLGNKPVGHPPAK